jgi:hypothetical protein
MDDRNQRKWAPERFPAPTLAHLIHASVPAEWQPRQHLCPFGSRRVERVRIEPERFQNRRRHLQGLNGAGDRLGLEARIRDQDHHVGVVARKAAMLGQFLAASCIWRVELTN